MKKIEVLAALLNLHYIDFAEIKTEELKVWLHSLRNINREIEREIVSRDRDGLPDNLPAFLSHHHN